MERRVLFYNVIRSVVFNGLYVKGDGLREDLCLFTEVCDGLLELFER